MAPGSSDNIEDILGKLGVGTLSGNSFSSPMGEIGPELTIYEYNDPITSPTSVAYLLSNMEELRKFHIIFFPCQAGIPTEIDTMLQTLDAIFGAGVGAAAPLAGAGGAVA